MSKINLENILPLPAKLSDEEFFILSLITYLDSALQQNTMQFICKQHRFNILRINDIVKKLSRLEITSLGSRYWAPYGNTYPQYYFAVTLRLLERHPDDVAYLESLYTKPSGIYEFLWRVAKALHTQDPKLISNIHLFPNWTRSPLPYLEPLFGIKEFMPAFASLNVPQMEQLLHDQLDDMLIHETWDEKQLVDLQDLIDYYGTLEPSTRDGFSDLMTTYSFLYEGNL